MSDKQSAYHAGAINDTVYKMRRQMEPCEREEAALLVRINNIEDQIIKLEEGLQ